MVGLGSGLLEVVCSQNGKDLGRVPYSGYMGNVSRLPTTPTLSQTDGLPIYAFVAGVGKTVIWYTILLVFPFWD
jgi:hypothetical protein